MPREGDAPFRVLFKATGAGTVFAQAYRTKDGAPAHSHHYTREGTHPVLSGLTAREKREWKAAAKAEWGL